MKKPINIYSSRLRIFELLKFIGPGLLVTVGFIDPGNWATDLAAGSIHGYSLLWVITISTVMLIILQHNAAHLGIATGYCISEGAAIFLKPWLSRIVLLSGAAAAISTAFAEILGGAIALNMLTRIPLAIGAVLMLALVLVMLFTNSYIRLEKWIIGFVSLIGISFIIELSLVKIGWSSVAVAWFTPSIKLGQMTMIMSVLGAVVMPHNLFLHSEVIQSRKWNLENEVVIKKQLKYEFLDTLFSMIVGWAINSAIIILAAAVFFSRGIPVNQLEQADSLLKPILGNAATAIFAFALLFSGIASSITAGMSGATIFAGMKLEHFDVRKKSTKVGVLITLVCATVIIFFIRDPFKALILSQMVLSIQLPITIFLQIYLTSSKKVMGKFRNSLSNNILLWMVGITVTGFNILLVLDLLQGKV